jgi:ABC-2 type transport system ATP-binding protein
MDLAIRTERMTKYYGSVPGVVDLDLDVPTGTVYGYLGPNGAGKSTTIRALLGLVQLTGGAARILELDSRSEAVKVRRRIGYLSDNPTFYDDMTAREQLRWLGKLRGGVKADDIKTLADRLGLLLDRKVADLSSSDRQKIGLIQAFVHSPELLILDEPSLRLDPSAQQVFFEMVREVRDDGRTVLLSSRYLPEVDLLCDWIGIIREARLVAVEEVADLRSRAMRSVTVRFAHDVPSNDLRELPGVQEVDISRDRARFQVVGEIDSLLKTLGRFPIVDLTMTPADLEDVFQRFYVGGSNVD